MSINGNNHHGGTNHYQYTASPTPRRSTQPQGFGAGDVIDVNITVTNDSTISKPPLDLLM